MFIYEGCAFLHAFFRLKHCWYYLTEYWMRILTERWNSVTTSAERKIVYDVKENHCYMALDYDTMLKSTAKYRLFEPPAVVELSLLSFELCGQSSDGEELVGLSWGQLDGPEKVESLAFPGSLLRALRPELGRREEFFFLSQTETPRREAWGFVFPSCRSHLQSGLASSLEKLAPCRLIGVRGKTSEEGFMGARRSTATGSARWFPYPTITWEPPLLTWVV